MSVGNKKYSFLILVLLIAGTAIILTCSDAALNSSDSDIVKFQMPLKFADGDETAAEVVTIYRVSVVAGEDTIVANLQYTNGKITGLIENLPAGFDRTIFVEGLAAGIRVIFRGSVITNIVAGETIDDEITVFAVAKLARMSPIYANLPYGNSLLSVIKVNNIIDLTSISLTINYDREVVGLDSINAAAGLPIGTGFSYTDEFVTKINLSYFSPIVNSFGNASLAIAYFSPVSANICIDSTNLDLSVDTLSAPEVTLNDIYVADSRAIINRGRLIVSDDTLKFGLGVTGLNLDIKKIYISDSCGNGSDYSISTEESWIDLGSALAGNTPDSISIDVDTTGLSSGMYEGRVRISSAQAVNSPLEIVVKVNLDLSVRDLQVSPGLIYFVADENGAVPATRRIHIEEAYGYNVAFSAAEDIPWLSINKTAGTSPDSVFATITTTALVPGTYTDTILITSPGAINSPKSVTIVYSVGDVSRNLNVAPVLMYFTAEENGGHPASQKIHLTEVGGNAILFSIGEEIPWLDINKNGGTTSDSITVSIISTALSPGTYADTIVILSGEADNSPRYVGVVYELTRAPRTLAIEPPTLHFIAQQDGAMPPPQTFRVFEPNGYNMIYGIVEDIPWLSVAGVSGFTEDTVYVYVNPAGLRPGLYNDSILIGSDDADNSPIYLTVSLGITVGPKIIEVDPNTLHFVYTPFIEAILIEQFKISEKGGFHIPYSAFENISWISLSHEGGTTEDSIIVSAIPGLAPGFYVDSIEISSAPAANSPVYVWVTFEVNEYFPHLETDPDSVHLEYVQYSDAYPNAQFSVSESGGYPFPYAVAENIDWIFLSDSNGTMPDTITVYFNNTALDSGIYVDSIQVSSSEADNSPIYVKVTLEIIYMPPPALDVFPDTLYFTAQENGTLPDSQNFNVYENSFPAPFIVTESIPWLFVTYDTGLVGSDVTVFISNTNLGPGTYFDSILVSTGSEDYIPAYEYIQYAVDSINLPPEQPIPISPDSGATNVPLNLSLITQSAANTDFYQFQYDDDESFTSIVISPDLADTVFSVGALDYETTYFWRVKAVNTAGSSLWSNVWSFTTVSAPPTISGIVRDSSSGSLADVLIMAFDNYPNGNVLDSSVTDSNGVFNFFNVNGNVDIHAFKDGYYPKTLAVTAPDTSVLFTLLDTTAFIRSSEWVDLYCDSLNNLGNLIQPHDVVEAFDPDSVLCGRFVVIIEGVYGPLQVFRDDSGTVGTDEGCITGDVITLKVNGEVILSDTYAIYPLSYENIEACYRVSGRSRR